MKFFEKNRMAALRFMFALCIMVFPVWAMAQKTMSMASSSMEPTIHKNGTVHVDLLTYLVSSPVRWDVAVYMHMDSYSFGVHRIIGGPGDRIEYTNEKRLIINGVAVVLKRWDDGAKGTETPVQTFLESWGDSSHLIQVDRREPAVYTVALKKSSIMKHCSYSSSSGLSCTVPSNMYFIMGDNRDFSFDSRYLGFISEKNIAGKVELLTLTPPAR